MQLSWIALDATLSMDLQASFPYTTASSRIGAYDRSSRLDRTNFIYR